MPTAREPCIHCGVFIRAEYNVHLKTIMQLSKLPPAKYAEEIARLEGMPLEVAQEFVDHKMGHNCKRSQAPCPSCTSPLKTWHASGCWTCGWRSPAGEEQPLA